MKKCMAISLLTLGLLAAPLLAAQAAAAPGAVAVVNLEPMLQGRPEATVEAGEGVSFRISASGEGGFRQNLAVYDGGRKVQDLEEGKFMEFARLEATPATYWVIGEFTGGAHCCGQFHCFSRPGPGQPLQYLGKTEGYNGGPMPLKGSFIFRDGQIYFRSFQNRFDYFHASHAESMIVNVPPVFYQLSPTNLTINNEPFKNVYLAEAAKVGAEISKDLATRRSRPKTILIPGGWGSGYDNLKFADPLGQLLVKRTIFYLYAGENSRAWETLGRDVKKHYQSLQWLGELQKEIVGIIKRKPE